MQYGNILLSCKKWTKNTKINKTWLIFDGDETDKHVGSNEIYLSNTGFGILHEHTSDFQILINFLGLFNGIVE